tara:strand:+ start:190 stop:600 length:411 start_codon:yes stop_codon:yes gene_type:complete
MTLLTPGVVQAECAQISPIKKDEVAACDGVLIRSDAVPSVIVNLTSADEKCNLKLKEQQEKSDAWCNAEKLKLVERIRVASELNKKRISIKNDQIAFLTGEIRRLKEPRTGYWIAAGVIAGVGMTVAAAWSLNQVK